MRRRYEEDAKVVRRRCEGGPIVRSGYEGGSKGMQLGCEGDAIGMRKGCEGNAKGIRKGCEGGELKDKISYESEPEQILESP